MINPLLSFLSGRSFLSQFRECLKAASADRAVRVFILSSAVPGVFCAGADLKVIVYCILFFHNK